VTLREWRDQLRQEPGAARFAMEPATVALGYALKYLVLVAYSITAVVFHVPSFVEVGGSLFAIGWAVVILMFSLGSLAALAWTWFTSRPRVEKWTTFCFILMLLAYSVVVGVRIALSGAWSGMGVVWLPIALAVFPTIRFYSLARRV
jgi:hypothetical protein